MKDTKNFSNKEFLCPCCGVEKMQQGFIDKLQQFREKLNKQINISKGGGYRCAAYNKILEKTANAGTKSRHMRGDAADIKIHGMTTEAVTKLAYNFGFDGVGIYDGHVHIDSRGYKAQWDYRTNKNAEHLMNVPQQVKLEEIKPVPNPTIIRPAEPVITVTDVNQEPTEPTQLEQEYKKDLENEETKKNLENNTQQEKTNAQNDAGNVAAPKETSNTQTEIKIAPEGLGAQIGRFSNWMTLLLTIILGGMYILEIPVNNQMENLWFIAFGKILGNEGINILTSKKK